jgi:menaquinone-dependent protoporphyrinogen oxidase
MTVGRAERSVGCMEAVMQPEILVAYASRHGSTQEVAEAVADVLREHDLQVQVRPAGKVRDLERFDAVVLGGALYTGRLHADARRFLERFRHELGGGTPIAVFAMGPKTPDPADVEGSREQLDRALARRPEIHPVSTAIFGGVIDPARLHFPFSHLPASDARDWGRIRAWAVDLARVLTAPSAVAP